jgi:glycosyltransferase involved in cell wall biosynthesis
MKYMQELLINMNRKKKVTVIIPTYNRGQVLGKCLAAFSRQTIISSDFEVLVVDDGSNDDTAAVSRQAAEKVEYQLIYLHQHNQGANAARNHGIRKASGKYLLFINDDTIPVPGMLSLHLATHDQYPEPGTAVLGKVTYSPELDQDNIFAAMHLDAAYAPFKGLTELDWKAFFTCNVSIKKSFLLTHGIFEKRMRYHEDLELSERLRHVGLRVIYAPEALGYHFHLLTEQEILTIAEREGTALTVWYQKAPHLGKDLAELGFHPAAGTGRRLRLALGDLLFNRLTQPLFLRLARLLTKYNQNSAVILYNKVFQARKRQYVRAGLR